MIKSMTGFGAGDAETADFKVHIEVKAVNQRFLETNYHMPYSMNMFENQLTKKIKEYASRGKLDINIRFQDLRDKAVTVKVDKGLVAAYGQALQEISSQLELSAPVTAAQIASYPDVLKLNEENADLEAAQPVLMQAMAQALESFVAMREAEGQNIQRDLLARIDTLENFVGELEKLAPEIVKGIQSYGVSATVKHYAANSQETNRLDIDERITKRALEEIFLPGFCACVKEGGTKTIMNAYNKINGARCTENKWLLQDKLRDDFGFEGDDMPLIGG